jgi:hypothetical protein
MMRDYGSAEFVSKKRPVAVSGGAEPVCVRVGRHKVRADKVRVRLVVADDGHLDGERELADGFDARRVACEAGRE